MEKITHTYLSCRSPLLKAEVVQEELRRGPGSQPADNTEPSVNIHSFLAILSIVSLLTKHTIHDSKKMYHMSFKNIGVCYVLATPTAQLPFSPT